MRPEDTTPLQQPQQGGAPAPQATQPPQQQAVARITREQIDAIYNKQESEEQLAPITIAPEPAEQHHQIDDQQWKNYHSSWQKYYQKYYEQYYVGAVGQAHDAYRQHAEQLQKAHQEQTEQAQQATEEPLSESEAIEGLRSELLGKIQDSAKKVRKSRHFLPIVAALSVLLVFAFLQYNAIIFSYAQAYVSPGNIDPQNIIVNPNESLKVGKEPRLIIPRFNIDVSVQYKNTMGNTAERTNDLQMEAMRKGVAYFGAPGFNAHPGQYGNFGIAGHSSNDFTDGGAAKFVFAPLLRMKKGDVFYLNYEGTRYTYSVKKIMEVAPNGVSALNVGTKKPMATLITCTPLGTANKRLLVFGEQISPSPSKASKAPTASDDSVDASQLTGTSPTVFERLFGG